MYYMSIFLVLSYIVSTFSAFFAVAALFFTLTIQMVDVYYAPESYRYSSLRKMRKGSQWRSSRSDAFWIDAARRYKKIRVLPIKNKGCRWQEYAYFAASNKLPVDGVYLARHVFSEKSSLNAYHAVYDGYFARDSLYFLDSATFNVAFQSGHHADDLFTVVDGYNVVAPGWKRSADGKGTGDMIESSESLVDKVTRWKSQFSHLPVIGQRLSFCLGGGSDYMLGELVKKHWGVMATGHVLGLFIPIESSDVQHIQFDILSRRYSLCPQFVQVYINGIESKVIELSYSGKLSVDVIVPHAAKSSRDNGLFVEFRLSRTNESFSSALCSFFAGYSPQKLSLGLEAMTLY